MTGARSHAASVEAAIVASPDDPAAYLVYGDYLQAAGDPRGELIAVQAARGVDDSHALQDAEAALLATHRAALLGPEDLIEHGRAEWYCGFWRRLYAGRHGGDAAVTRDEHIAQLVASPSARFLRYLNCCGVLSTRVLELFAPLTGTLRELHVSRSQHGTFADEDLLALEPLTGLRALYLFSCEPLTAEGFALLQGLPELSTLDLRNSRLTDAVARSLTGLPLRNVMFNQVTSAFSAHGMAVLAEAPLVRLSLNTEQADDALVAPLAGHPTLANLELRGSTLGVAGLRAIGSARGLRRLALHESKIDGRDLTLLAPLAGGLESLHLGHSQTLTDPACEVLGAFERLGYLDLSATRVTGRGARALGRIGTLTQLDLSFLALDDDDVASLAGLSALEGLNLAHNRLTDRAIDALVQMTKLEKLDLAGTNITSAAIDRLATLPHLRVLGLEDCDSATIARAERHEGWYVYTRDLVELDDAIFDLPSTT